MSRAGCPYDNAPMERFYNTFKKKMLSDNKQQINRLFYLVYGKQAVYCNDKQSFFIDKKVCINYTIIRCNQEKNTVLYSICKGDWYEKI